MVKYVFEPEKARDEMVENIRVLAEMQGFSKVVVGISGGKDSTVTAALCARALGKKNVIGIMLPDGLQKDIEDSVRVCKALGISYTTVNIGGIHQELIAQIGFADPDTMGDHEIHFVREADINVAPRLRMTVLRYITQALGARLAGTGNLSEATVGYCTKDGDTSCDFSVLGGLTSVEVVQVGLTMEELPEDLVRKTPSDGLCGMSDEEKLGVSYEDIHHYIRRDKEIDQMAYNKIKLMDEKNRHKRERPRVLYLWEPF